MNARMPMAVLLLSMAACNGGDEGDTAGNTDAGTDGGTNGGDWQVPDDAPLIEMDGSFWKNPGVLSVKGTIQLPADTRSGVYTVLDFEQYTAGRLNGFAATLGPYTTGARYIRFVITGLNDEAYKFHFFVDQNNNGDIDSGDYQGWYAGTLEHPLLTSDEATLLKLEGRNHEGINFGIGRSR